ncbi:MAG: hypothetical protein EZS28_045209 [Streblomastix strix]|uniref:Uncharacterized protein n=1 Tax=Streblomastix strix TaxID=222440 RepID=A0A5J4TLJ0_9EUKA|nr:MAG: hypothetical protein EZS28_045209 [Streblomastix strix]
MLVNAFLRLFQAYESFFNTTLRDTSKLFRSSVADFLTLQQFIDLSCTAVVRSRRVRTARTAGIGALGISIIGFITLDTRMALCFVARQLMRSPFLRINSFVPALPFPLASLSLNPITNTQSSPNLQIQKINPNILVA